MNTPRHSLRSRLLTAALVGSLSSTLLHAAPVEVSGTGSYSQNFDTLAIDGTDNVWADDTTLPAWYSNRTVYIANSGNALSGALYSYGASESTERALGAQGSGTSGTIYFGVLFQNTSASPVEIDSISYTGEQWRYSGTTAAQTLTFGFTTDSLPITDLVNGTWQSVTDLNFTSPVISGTTGPLDGNDPANQAALSSNVQIIIPPGEFAMLRWEEIDHPGNDHGLSADDLNVTWKPSTGVDVVPPEFTELVPATGSSDLLVSAVDELTIFFNEVCELGTGDILIKRASDNETVLTIDASAEVDFFILENEGLILLPDPSPFEAGEGYYVEIPSGAVTDLAGNPFAGFTLPTDWSFSFAEEAQPPTVVINKYSNNPDIVEVLVVGDGTPGSTVDMTGMILKDFSSNMNGDSGGKYELAVNDLWSAVPVGTLVSFVAGSATSSDVDDSNFTLSVGLDDIAYSTSLGGSFNISNTEMVLIKSAGSEAAGTSGGIHALAGGAEAGTFFINFPGNKLLASAGGTGVIALNSTSTLADYNGEDADGGVALT
ncbi:Ig-like domain-containing protein, partial [Haloferula sp.]|uniref:Ig-like domain-containing protein n=1 Tax=Haloferula sp. TaxID=2497595 RepID=UPI003C72E9C7